MPAAGLTLISHQLCPFVQRATISLAEKGGPFEHRYVDLSNKPDWFLQISPLGKVPLLVVQQADGSEAVLFESAVICEYLEETQPGIALHPEDALLRAQHRSWIEFCSTIISDLWGFMTAPDATTWEAKRKTLTEKFSRLEAELGEGPYFSGEKFSLVDAAFAPVFRYFDVFDITAPTGVFDDLPRVAAWGKALAARPSVRAAVKEGYAEQLKAMVRAQDGWLLKRAA